MLTEPLTLPPRRWQQLALAAVVGVLFAMPFNFGFVANSPELALLAGNLLAFLAGQRGSVRLLFSHSRRLTPTTTEFVFEPRRPVRHEPGQYMELDLPHAKPDGKGRRRVFSLTSSPGRDAREDRRRHRRPRLRRQAQAPGAQARGRTHGHHRGGRLRPAAKDRTARSCSLLPASALRRIWRIFPAEWPGSGTLFCCTWPGMRPNLPMRLS